MKNYYFFLLFLLGFQGHAQIHGYNLNDVVDDFTVTDIHGETHNLYSYTSEGKYVYLDFSFTTCGPCQGVAPKFNEFYDKYGCNTGDIVCLSIFGTNSDNNSDVENFETTYGGTFNHAPATSNDGGAIAVDNDFNPYQYPTICLIAPDNKIINLDIWPINDISDLEATFPEDFNPEIINCSTIAVQEFQDEVGFTVFPNPFNGKELQINTQGISEAQVQIYNLIGEIVFSKMIFKNQNIIHTDLPSGTYIISLYDNKKNKTQKLIVK